MYVWKNLFIVLKSIVRFDITFEVEPELEAISNMNIVEEKMTENGKKIVKFATTPLMSTNLVAFAVGDFTSIHVRIFLLKNNKQ